MSGPARTGSVESFKRVDGTTYFRGRIRLGDGSRKWIDVPEKHSTPAGGKTARECADLYVAARQERDDETGELLTQKRAAAQTSAATWLAALDRQPMASVTREQIVTIRDGMTAAVLARKISAKRAMNMGSDFVVAPFSSAFTDDDPRYSGVRVDLSADLMPFDFRSWRTTGCTWLAMLGTDSYVIAQQAGHKSPDTTWGSYIKQGPDLRRRYGEPFPPLPPELFADGDRAS
jgi:hypothetical protein